MPDLNFRGKFRPLENIGIDWLKRSPGLLEGVASIGEHEVIVELVALTEGYSFDVTFMPPTDPDAGSSHPLPDFLKPYIGHQGLCNGVTAGRFRAVSIPRRGKPQPDGTIYWADYYNFAVLKADVTDADGDAAIEAAGGFSRAEVAELGRLADAEDWDSWQAMMDFIDGGRV